MPSFKPEKLRVNLRLCINRLKLLEKKKTEEAMKARREIADYIKNKRTERARIRVEHIIREDYLVEAMEVVELYCDLLLARFGMLEQMMYCEESLAESVATLIWVAPRLCSDVQELNQVALQLENKFGKPFAQQARSNMSGTVNPKVIHRLGVEAPKKSLVENYLIEIARNYKVDYEPDPSMFLEDDGIPSEPTAAKPFLPDDEPQGGAGPLPQKEEPRYIPTPSTQPQPPPSQPYGGGGGGGGALPPAYPGPPTQPPPPTNPGLPYPTAPQPGVVNLPPLPPSSDNLDLPPVPRSNFSAGPPPPSAPAPSGPPDGGDMDFDDLTRRFEELKKRK